MTQVPEAFAAAVRAEGGDVSFARFMELALGHPGAGYYGRSADVLGYRGDFTTAPVASPLFSRGVARFVEQLLDGLFTVAPGDVPAVVELGAGNGELAAGILDYACENRPDLQDRVAFQTVDRSPTLRARQSERLRSFADAGWQVSVRSDLEPVAGPAVLYANEFLDALPVRRVRLRSGVVEEAWVVLDPGQYVREEWRAPSPEAVEELERLFGGAEPAALEALTEDGHLELRPEVGRLMARLAEAFPGPCCLVWIDYGEYVAGPDAADPNPSRADVPDSGAPGPHGRGPRSLSERTDAEASEPPRRALHRSTVRAYFKHQQRSDLYRLAGRQDLTADVDFRALDVHAARHGFDRLLLTNLAGFLRSVGVHRDLERLRENYTLEGDREGTVLAALLDEDDVGGIFKVMVHVRE